MPGRGGRDNGSKKSESKQMLENLRDACPPHKKRDLEQLAKQLGGDEEKIRQKIQEWWDEPQQPQEEEQWEDVGKKAAPKPVAKGRGSGGRGGGRFGNNPSAAAPPGRGGRGDRREGRGARAGGRSGGGRGGAGRFSSTAPTSPPKQQQSEQQQPGGEETKDAAEPRQAPSTGPRPVAHAPAPKGAWGRPPPPTPVPVAPTETVPAQQAVAAPSTPEKPAASIISDQPTQQETLAVDDVGVVSKNDPTPSGIDTKPVRAAPAGNVWATKGSAHLIQAEKPKPPPATIVSPAPAPPAYAPPSASVVTPGPQQSKHMVEPEPAGLGETLEPEGPVAAAVSPGGLETGMPSAVTSRPVPSSNAWGSNGKPDISSTPQDAAVVIQASPVSAPMALPVAAPPVVEEMLPPAPSPKAPAPPATKPPRPAPANVLNMGHWETGDADDSQNLDFGFGSFGADSDVATDSAPPEATGAAATPTTSASPARPPPGLSIGGMPPMPAGAVLVHELENSLENTSLNPPVDHPVAAPQEKPITNALPPQPTAQVPSVPTGAPPVAPVLPQQNYNQYGMPGMYNYGAAGAAGTGFVGVPTPSPFLGIPHQQPGHPPKAGTTSAGGADATSQSLHPQASLYGHGSAPSSGNAGDTTTTSTGANSTGANANANPASGMPPGMPNMPAYANPALYYGQQPFHLGQHQGGVGYGYGYGQFGGAVQGGFGYQQGMMGQSGAYGAPHYGDEGHNQPGPPHQGHTASHTGGTGGYKNSGGGYRGRNNHHNNNQYQNQYNPQQHGGYGGQPYGMGYHNDHFNQRGAYGHGNMGDPYGMQQQQQQQHGGIHAGGGFHQDDTDHHNKGRRGGGGGNRNNNSNSLQQFQGGPPHGQLGGQQQPFGLQGPGNDTTQTTGATGGGSGWSNNQGGGGWNSGGTSSWQQSS